MKRTLGNGKTVEDWKLWIEGHKGDDSFVEWAKFEDGTLLNDQELEEFERLHLADLVWG